MLGTLLGLIPIPAPLLAMLGVAAAMLAIVGIGYAAARGARKSGRLEAEHEELRRQQEAAKRNAEIMLEDRTPSDAAKRLSDGTY